ncbi:hypothetical protein D3C71_387110 [compost metagenome]
MGPQGSRKDPDQKKGRAVVTDRSPLNLLGRSRATYFFGACFWPVRIRPERDTWRAPPRAPFWTATL